MATLAQLRTRVDAWLADKWPTIVARQQNYFANRGTYWQGLRTHTITPTHTNGADGDSVPDRLASNPTDQFSNWLNVFPEWNGVPIPCCIWCDTYGGPDGQGWIASIEIIHNGTKYARSQNVGPESWRTEGWHVVQDEE